MKLIQPLTFVTLALATSSMALPMTRGNIDMRGYTEEGTLVRRENDALGRVKAFFGNFANGFGLNLRKRDEPSSDLQTRSFEGQLYARDDDSNHPAASKAGNVLGNVLGTIVKAPLKLLGLRRRDESSADLQARSPTDELNVRGSTRKDALKPRGLLSFIPGPIGAVLKVGAGLKALLGGHSKDSNKRRDLSSSNLQARSSLTNGSTPDNVEPLVSRSENDLSTREVHARLLGRSDENALYARDPEFLY